ncbi:DUF4231 domain-containing protein [Nocardia tengchongensis]|uniref:DUF4231 domain-containing protein n=1 Tax=Nocardia tengchongensis TaxID=2055889 RepID=UPI003677A99E
MAGSAAPNAQTDAMAEVIDWKAVGPAFHQFWTSTYAHEVANTTRLTGRFRNYGQFSRFLAMVASAVVTGLAGFEGSLIRAATAVAGGIAVVATGSAALFRTDQRLAANRRTQQALLSEGWKFVSGADGYEGGPTPANATKFITTVELLLSTYIDTYVRTIDEPTPAG